MEITVGTQFKKVGTDDIVTVTKYDNVRGTVVVKFPSGRSIPMSTGSLMKAEKWEYLGSDEDEPVVEETKTETEEKVEEKAEEKPKKEKKRKPVAKMRKTKAVTLIGSIVENAFDASSEWDIFDFNKDTSSWIIYDMRENPQVHIVYNKKDKLLDIEMTDELAKRLVDTEFDNLGTIDAKFIEDKLTELLNILVEKGKNKESEEQVNG